MTSSPADDIPDLYQRHAQAWDAARVDRGLEGAWLEKFAAALPPGATVLDIGCGAGEPIARRLMKRGFKVTGVDAAPALIALAQARLPAGDWRVGDMRALDLGARFEGLIAWHSLFHLTPQAQQEMFARFAAHAAPGAALMFTSGATAGETIGAFEGAPLYHASLDPAEYRALLAAHEFTLLDHALNDPAAGEATVWLARFSGG
jgi:SAM-dependent methyltransferase